MAKLTELLIEEDLNKAWVVSDEKPVLIFKQSTTCPISAEAFEQFKTYLKHTDLDIGAFFVKVRESRSVSNQLAKETDIQHESPQIFLIEGRQVIWHTSHSDISIENIKNAIDKRQLS